MTSTSRPISDSSRPGSRSWCISIDDLRAFLAVARHESFVAAADELHITAPALTRRIKKLEEELGCLLFERTTQSVEITRTGRVLLEQAEKPVREFDAFREFACGYAQGDVARISFACMWSTAASIAPFLIRDYLKIEEGVEFDVHDAEADLVNLLVRDRHVDFAISMRPEETGELGFVPLCTDPFVLACPPEHALYDREAITWADLVGRAKADVTWDIIHLNAFWPFREDLIRAGIDLPAGRGIQHISTHLGFLEAGLQALVQPLLGAGLSHRPGIRFIPITDPSILREIGMVVRRNARLPDPVVAFQNHVVENVPRLYEQAISGR